MSKEQEVRRASPSQSPREDAIRIQGVIYTVFFGLVAGSLAWAGFDSTWGLVALLVLLALRFFFDFLNRDGIFGPNYFGNSRKSKMSALKEWGTVIVLAAILIVAALVPHHSVSLTVLMTAISVVVMAFATFKGLWPGK